MFSTWMFKHSSVRTHFVTLKWSKTWMRHFSFHYVTFSVLIHYFQNLEWHEKNNTGVFFVNFICFNCAIKSYENLNQIDWELKSHWSRRLSKEYQQLGKTKSELTRSMSLIILILSEWLICCFMCEKKILLRRESTEQCNLLPLFCNFT